MTNETNQQLIDFVSQYRKLRPTDTDSQINVAVTSFLDHHERLGSALLRNIPVSVLPLADSVWWRWSKLTAVKPDGSWAYTYGR